MAVSSEVINYHLPHSSEVIRYPDLISNSFDAGTFLEEVDTVFSRLNVDEMPGELNISFFESLVETTMQKVNREERKKALREGAFACSSERIIYDSQNGRDFSLPPNYVLSIESGFNIFKDVDEGLIYSTRLYTGTDDEFGLYETLDDGADFGLSSIFSSHSHPDDVPPFETTSDSLIHCVPQRNNNDIPIIYGQMIMGKAGVAVSLRTADTPILHQEEDLDKFGQKWNKLYDKPTNSTEKAWQKALNIFDSRDRQREQDRIVAYVRPLQDQVLCDLDAELKLKHYFTDDIKKPAKAMPLGDIIQNIRSNNGPFVS